MFESAGLRPNRAQPDRPEWKAPCLPALRRTDTAATSSLCVSCRTPGWPQACGRAFSSPNCCRAADCRFDLLCSICQAASAVLGSHSIGNWKAALIAHLLLPQPPPKLWKVAAAADVHAACDFPAMETLSVWIHTPCSKCSLEPGPETKGNHSFRKSSIARASMTHSPHIF